MSRQRLTWDGDALPVERARAASAHPATPDEGPAHPAHQPDPEASDYENGDTSSWAEDVHPGPYPNSAHPATPDEGPAHPAHKAAAMELRASVEQKAQKCIRVASVLLGKTASDDEIEKQALDLMDLPEVALQSTLNRLATLDRFAADEDEEESDDEAGKHASEDELLRQMMAEEGMDSDKEANFNEMAEVESMLADMMKEEMAPAAPMAMEEEEPAAEMAMDHDPMGMYDMGMDEEEEMLLSQLFAEHTASDKSADDDEDDSDDSDDESDDDGDDEGESDKEEGKKASAQRPRPKKASAGPARLGGVTKEASNDVNELSKLWPSAPDISDAF